MYRRNCQRHSVHPYVSLAKPLTFCWVNKYVGTVNWNLYIDLVTGRICLMIPQGLFCIYGKIPWLERSPAWEANSSSSSRGIPPILWSPKGHYRVHTSPPPPFYPEPYESNARPPYFFEAHFNIIFTRVCCSCLFSLGFASKTLYAFITMRVSCFTRITLRC
jgi:hypothetical protein